MGSQQVDQEKNIYYRLRKEANMTRARAVDEMDTISERRLESLEYGETDVQPADVIEMAKAYKHPELCNYYCSHECPIGKEYVPEVEIMGLSDIVLKILSSLNEAESAKNRLIEMTEDGTISDDEIPDFVKIRSDLKKLSTVTSALDYWVRNTISDGKINVEKMKEYEKNQEMTR
ncbi:helix-turn-helix domain-containing protein [Bilifractor sp. LCP19S3_H10]|uniref:helix-turn-helix domain-containing protein n=1 Tax=Bilifractor sp. LCP19S3_H10 TaxID=3438736 RepID=UPI003F8EA8EA